MCHGLNVCVHPKIPMLAPAPQCDGTLEVRPLGGDQVVRAGPPREVLVPLYQTPHRGPSASPHMRTQEKAAVCEP